jgi:membrane fusion protein (multidrug efflux system)
MQRFVRAVATLPCCVALTVLVTGCDSGKPPPPRRVAVTVMHVVPKPVAVSVDYPAQLEASNTVEIRPRVNGVLERQEGIEGQPVRAGQVLFVIDQQPYRAALAQAQAVLAQAEAGRAQAERDLERAKPLSQLDALSQRELDAAEAAGAATAAQVRAAQAAVRTAELNLGFTVVRAPIDGTMSRALVRVGGVVTAYSTALTMLYKMDPMYVNFSISEQRLLQLQRELGRPLDQRNRSSRQFHVFLADGTEIAVPATLNFMDAAVDDRTDTLPVRLSIANPQGILRSGQYVKVSIETPEQADALVIPQRAIQEFQDKRFVWIVDAAGKAQQRDVVMGARIGPDWLVSSGLAAGDVVVVDGTQKLKPDVMVDTTPPGSAH